MRRAKFKLQVVKSIRIIAMLSLLLLLLLLLFHLCAPMLTAYVYIIVYIHYKMYYKRSYVCVWKKCEIFIWITCTRANGKNHWKWQWWGGTLWKVLHKTWATELLNHYWVNWIYNNWQSGLFIQTQRKKNTNIYLIEYFWSRFFFCSWFFYMRKKCTDCGAVVYSCPSLRK